MKNVVIIGASGSIGKEMVKTFYKKGYNVFAGYFKNKSAIEKQIACLPVKKNRIVMSHIDTRDLGSVTRFFDEFKVNFGIIDCLVNCSGVSKPNLLIDINLEDLQQEMDVNLLGVILTSKQSLELFGDDGGSIINLASIWGICGGAYETTYSATKGGVIAFSKALAKEMGSKKIRVNTISPGLVKSPMNIHLTDNDYLTVKQESPLKRLATAREIAECALYLAGESAKSITGQNITIDAGFIL